MYQQRFWLGLTQDPAFPLLGQQRREVLAAVEYGKTTVLRSLTSRLAGRRG
jgi:hypothetical protein